MENEKRGLDLVRVRMIPDRTLFSSKPVSNPEEAVNLIIREFRDLDREIFMVMNLTCHMQVINLDICSVGTLTYTVVHPRDIFKTSILSNAANVMLIHLCEASHKWIYAKCFFMRSFSLDPADSLVFKGDIASHKTVTDSYVAIGSSPPSVYRNTASLTQELGCS